MSNTWPQVPLGEILTRSEEWTNINLTDTYREITVRLWGKGVSLRREANGSEIASTRRLVAKAGHLILSRIDARNGAFGLVPDSLDGAVVSNDFPVFAPNRSRLLPSFLDWMSQTRPFVDICKAASEGTTNRVRLQEDRFVRMTIPLPSLQEQRRIVARIEKLATKINEARTLRQQAAEEADTLIANEIKARFDGGKKFGWTCGTLGNWVIDDCYGTSEKTNDDDSGTPVLRMGNIQNGCLDLRDLKYLHVAEKDRAKLVLKRGDILVNRTNSAELVGKCAVFDMENDFAFASYLIRLRLDTKRADPRLVASYINSPAGRAYMFSERKQMTGQANVNATKLKALPLELPPLVEQHRIVGELDALQANVDALKKLQAETATELDALMPSILAKAFKGEL
jgi:type I restriction enzyme S subunit